MNAFTYKWLEAAVERIAAKGRVLEVGSLDVNGSARPLFDNRKRFPEYVGIDLVAGEGVDLVCNANDLLFPSGSFDVYLSTSVLEHDAAFWKSLKEGYRILSKGGVAIVTTCGIRQPFHHPPDYYRFTKEGLKVALELAGFVEVESEGRGYTEATARKK